MARLRRSTTAATNATTNATSAIATPPMSQGRRAVAPAPNHQLDVGVLAIGGPRQDAVGRVRQVRRQDDVGLQVPVAACHGFAERPHRPVDGEQHDRHWLIGPQVAPVDADGAAGRCHRRIDDESATTVSCRRRRDSQRRAGVPRPSRARGTGIGRGRASCPASSSWCEVRSAGRRALLDDPVERVARRVEVGPVRDPVFGHHLCVEITGDALAVGEHRVGVAAVVREVRQRHRVGRRRIVRDRRPVREGHRR